MLEHESLEIKDTEREREKNFDPILKLSSKSNEPGIPGKSFGVDYV